MLSVFLPRRYSLLFQLTISMVSMLLLLLSLVVVSSYAGLWLYAHQSTLQGDRQLIEWSISRSILASCLVALAIGFFVLAPVGFASVYRFSKRLSELTSAMLRIAHNDTSAKVPIANGDDEVGDMVRALQVFKANAISLLEKQGQIEKLNFRFKIALNNMSRGLSMFDAQERLVVSNQLLHDMYNTPAELSQPGARFRDILDHRGKMGELLSSGGPSGMDQWHELYARKVGERRTFSVTYRLYDGRTIQITYKPLSDGGCVAIHEDVTEKRRADEKIQKLALQDTLTGVANRLHFRQKLAELLAENDGRACFAVHMIDLDHFKEVNDTLGHPSGDQLLKMVAARLVKTARTRDVVARIGGDEFAIIQHDVCDEPQADAMARRVLSILCEDYAVSGNRVRIGASIGATLAFGENLCADEILKRVDIALYRAKALGREQVVHFKPELEETLKSRRMLEDALRDAVRLNQLRLHFQPIYDLKSGRIASCEALMRWRHPTCGMVSPGTFIPLAEETGLISEIGQWALFEACKTAKSWPHQTRVSVNLSAVQFECGNVAQIVRQALDQTGLPPQRLILEVTESLLLRDDPSTHDVLAELQGLGVSISLDDFGTGYSSLSYLRSFPFDSLKIDRSFINDLDADDAQGTGPRSPRVSQAAAILKAVTGLARELNMTTVAEGVETEAQLARVFDLGCAEVQGFLLSRPVPDTELIALLEADESSSPLCMGCRLSRQDGVQSPCEAASHRPECVFN